MDDNKIFICKNYAITNAVEDGNFLKIEGYACHFNQKNLNNEIVDEKSFKDFFELYNAKKVVPALNWSHTDTIIGNIDKLESKSDGLFMQARLNKSVKIVEDMIAPNILSGAINSFSTEGYCQGGYDGIVYNEKDGSYYVKSFLLTAVAVVAVPADWEAKFSVSNLFKNNKPQEPETKRRSIIWLM